MLCYNKIYVYIKKKRRALEKVMEVKPKNLKKIYIYTIKINTKKKDVLVLCRSWLSLRNNETCCLDRKKNTHL